MNLKCLIVGHEVTADLSKVPKGLKEPYSGMPFAISYLKADIYCERCERHLRTVSEEIEEERE